MMKTLQLFLKLVLILSVLTGCSATVRDIPVVTDSEKLLEIEQMRNKEEHVDQKDRLKNMSAKEHLDNGYKFLSRNDLSLAKLHFSLAVAKDDDLVDGYVGLSDTLVKNGKYAASKEVLTKALAKNDQDIRTLSRMGIVCRGLGEYQESLKYLIKANEISSNNAWLLTELAISYETSGQMELAEDNFLKVVQLELQSSSALNNLGFNYLLQGKHTEAIPILEKALKWSSGNRLVMNNLALAYTFNQQQQRALQLFEASVGKAGAYNNLGYLLMLQNQKEDAEIAFNQAMDLNPVFYERAKKNLDILQLNNR